MEGHHQPEPQPVRIASIGMSFGEMVWLAIKWSFAVVPAAIIWTIIYAIVRAILNDM
jgi:hypothetical protein